MHFLPSKIARLQDAYVIFVSVVYLFILTSTTQRNSIAQKFTH